MHSQLMRLSFLGYEIIFRKCYFNKFHITDHNIEIISGMQYIHDFNMDKRIEAMVGHNKFIDFIFRDFSDAIRTYGYCAIEILNGVIERLVKIRTTLKQKGASEAQLKKYDDKVVSCYNSIISTIQHRIESDNSETQQYDIKLLHTIQNYNINGYHLK